jgi:hypothetical protein
MTAQESRLRLSLHHERDVVSIGEPIRPKLQVTNEGDGPVRLDPGFVFDWERLAFAPPNEVHLLGPDGADMMAPYRADRSEFQGVRPPTIPPDEDAWMFLPIHAHLRLRTPGRYTFRLALAAEGGTPSPSNRVPFQLVDVPASAPPESIALRLEPRRTDVGVATLQALAFELDAVFRNDHREALVFLRPQEDSYHGWVNPVYHFTVTDAAGRRVAIMSRSGTMATPVYNATARFRLAPGETARQPLRLPPFPGMWRPGSYTVRLTYLVRDRAIGKDGVVLDRPMGWEPEVFVGRLESNERMVNVHA